jgi:hypothetical protein
MKFKYRYPKKVLSQGDVRVVKRFAWFPINLDDKTRVWLEYYNVIQKYKLTFRNYDYGEYCFIDYYTYANNNIINKRQLVELRRSFKLKSKV